MRTFAFSLLFVMVMPLWDKDGILEWSMRLLLMYTQRFLLFDFVLGSIILNVYDLCASRHACWVVFLSILYWDQSDGEPEMRALLNMHCLRLDSHFMFVVIQGWWYLTEENLDGTILSIHSMQAFLNIPHKILIGVRMIQKMFIKMNKEWLWRQLLRKLPPIRSHH